MDIKKTLENYIDDLSSNSPTPGGGNVAALCGVLASSLGEMVCNLTAGKKKYIAVEGEINELKEKLINYKNDFLHLGQKDNEAFDKVMDAFKLPKETDSEKALRTQAIENATISAADVPAQVIGLVKEVLPVIGRIADIGNQNSVSDAGVGTTLLASASEGAFLNVMINCSSLSNKTIAAELLKRSEIIYSETQIYAKEILNSIKAKLTLK
ncbi:MAG: cyclodeaminase/cyclohydrolase family protein [Ignavibacteriales bacterium]|nr:cyclodeaminase/cyclohydrolase family protein [Ignavibacteriales bacterium]HOJ19508.1 cyclodeaminase/cyclohydrolase family protein [Ignavibacteriaceae bacterium]HPO56288.1 cyclodeaminase/cyclohydrolase family protein [Ignavibacteriaceae bacterium]